MSQTEQLQELLAWLPLPTPRERYYYLAKHLELLTLEHDHAMDVLIGLFSDQPEEQKRLRIEQQALCDARARGGTAEAVRQAYIDEYGGLVVGLPYGLEEVEHMLSARLVSRQSERARSVTKMLLKYAIEYVQTDHSLPAEMLAELHYQLGTMFAQDLPGQSIQLLTMITTYYEAALLIYTPDRYPKQYAKVQVALKDVYRFCQAAIPWEH